MTHTVSFQSGLSQKSHLTVQWLLVVAKECTCTLLAFGDNVNT